MCLPVIPQLLCSLLLTTIVMVMIPREKLISDSAIDEIKMSPDGTTVGFIALDANKMKNVFTLRLSDRLKRQVTFEESHVKDFQWTGVKDVIIFSRDTNGNENFMLFKKNISESTPPHESVVISENPNVTAEIKANDQKESYVLVAMNDVILQFHNIYKFDLLTNELSLIFTNTRFQLNYIYTDNNMNIQFGAEEQEDGSLIYYRVSPNANSSILTSDEDQWEEYYRVKPDDVPVTRCIGFDETSENVYWIVGEDTDLGKLIITPFSDFSQQKVLHKASQGELQNFLFHPEDNALLAFAEYYHKPKMVMFHDSVADDLQFLANLRPADSLIIKSISRNLDTWLYTYLSWESPNEIFVYHRPQQTTDFLFHLNSDLEGYTLSKQIGFDFIARDGLRIQAYLSLPVEAKTKNASDVSNEDKPFADLGMIPAQPQKMVLLVHGGPNMRNTYGFDARVAHLTSRGYAVLQVNFRASTGFGKKLTMAGNGEWSRKMHTDLLDAVDFAVAKGIANRSQVAIMGWSYYVIDYSVVYETISKRLLRRVCYSGCTPEVFACGVDIYGPANLITIIETIPPYWAGYRNSLVKKPLMIIQGANDPRVKQDKSEQFVAAMKDHSTPVTYVLYPDEGHIFKKTPNLQALFGFVERFLHNCLGGEYEPFTNGQYNESAIVNTRGI